MGILDYSTTPSSNTAINGIGIAGSNSIKNGDDAMRQMMADTRAGVTKVVDKSAGSYTAAKSDYNQLWRVTGAATINLTAAATLTAGWCLWVMGDGGTATIDPSGSEQINGATTLSVATGNSALVLCTGTEFRAILFNKAFDTGTLGAAAYKNVGTTAGTVAAGDDGRIIGAFQSSNVIDEDDMSSDSDTKVPTQQSAKAYVDGGIATVTTALAAKIEVYTGSTLNETNFPIGHHIFSATSGFPDRNDTATPRINSSDTKAYGFTTGTTLSGTWRGRGGGLVQRTA